MVSSGLGCTSKAALFSQGTAVLVGPWCLPVRQSSGRSSRAGVKISVWVQNMGRPRTAMKSRKDNR